MRTSRPSLRWLVPIAVVAAVLVAGAATAAVRATAGAGLVPQTAAQLLVDLQGARLGAGTGTVVEHADLGIPALPQGVGGGGSAQFDSLIAGSHTLRVWYDGPQRERIALIGTLGESDVIHNGPDLWIWSSADNSATHLTVPVAPAGAAPAPAPSATASLTPSAIADDVLAALTPTTTVRSGPTTTVADRPAYTLIVAPKDPASLIGSVQIAIDGARHVPLRVQIFAAGSTKPAFEVGYSDISFTTPDSSMFQFNPPPGATVKQEPVKPAAPGTATIPPSDAPRVIGSGWTAILSVPAPVITGGTGKPDDGAIDAILKNLPNIDGPWGTGKIITTKLFSALLTSDGRLYLGAISGNALLAAVTTATK